MAEEPFAGARLKVKWADHHINELNAKVRAFLQTDFHRIVSKLDPQQGGYSLQFEVTRPLPDDLPLVIGDAIHNLRSALDHVAYEIVSRAGKTPSDYLTFPAKRTREKVIAAVDRHIQAPGVDSDICCIIIDGIQPYLTGKGRLIFDLHNLDCIDKHRNLIPTLELAGVRKFSAHNQESGSVLVGLTARSTGNIQRLVRSDTPFQIDDHGEPTYDILFQNVESFGGQPVIPTLHQLSQAVSAVIDIFAEEYRSRGRGVAQAPPPEGRASGA